MRSAFSDCSPGELILPGYSPLPQEGRLLRLFAAVCLRPACVGLCFCSPRVCHAYLQSPVVEAEARGAGRTELNSRGAPPPRDLGNRAVGGADDVTAGSAEGRPAGLARAGGSCLGGGGLRSTKYRAATSLSSAGAARGSLLGPAQFCASGQFQDEWGRRPMELDANGKTFPRGPGARSFPGRIPVWEVLLPRGGLPKWN